MCFLGIFASELTVSCCLLYNDTLNISILYGVEDKNIELFVKHELAGETEVLRENLSQLHFVCLNSHMASSGIEPGQPLWDEGG